ncbi:MAG TPA: hypothetical protein PK200_11780, partial [Spirochaetota bacterium]|nr:hypothetical protein [Spirochaetota bacterium]
RINTDVVVRHEGAHTMNRRAFAILVCSTYGECSCRSKARRRVSRGMGAPPGEGQRPSPGEMRSISGTDPNGGKEPHTMNRDS